MGDTGVIDNDFVADGRYNDWVAYFNKHASKEYHVTPCQELYGYDTTPIEYPGDRFDFVQTLGKNESTKHVSSFEGECNVREEISSSLFCVGETNFDIVDGKEDEEKEGEESDDEEEDDEEVDEEEVDEEEEEGKGVDKDDYETSHDEVGGRQNTDDEADGDDVEENDPNDITDLLAISPLRVVREHRELATGDIIVDVAFRRLPGSPTLLAFKDEFGELSVPMEMRCNQATVAIIHQMIKDRKNSSPRVKRISLSTNTSSSAVNRNIFGESTVRNRQRPLLGDAGKTFGNRNRKRHRDGDNNDPVRNVRPRMH